MRASGNGQTFHQQCRRYSGRNAQDKCHLHYKSENAEKVMFWNMKKNLKLMASVIRGRPPKNWLFLPCVRCCYTFHPQQSNDKWFRTRSLNAFSVPSHISCCQGRENIKREKNFNIVYHNGHDTLPSQKATVIMRASGNGQTFHQQCRRYSGRNARQMSPSLQVRKYRKSYVLEYEKK